MPSNEFTLDVGDGQTITVRLSIMDRIMRVLLSKDEFTARMLEKADKEREKFRSGQR